MRRRLHRKSRRQHGGRERDVIGGWSARLRSAMTSPVTPYVGAVFVRAGSRVIWGLALPAVLTVAAYGRYQLLMTVAVMAAQLALLGTPQTIVRQAGHRVPMGTLLAHGVVLSAVLIAAAPLVLPAIRGGTAIAVLSGFVLATILATAYGARAKARFAFNTSWRAELVGAGVLVFATTIVALGSVGPRDLISPELALAVEAFALAATTAVLVFALRSRRGQMAESPAAPLPTLFADVYSVGGLVLLDVVLFRRLEVYFLERSPDGLAGVAVLGLALQIAAVAMLVPTALLEAWQPKLAVLRRSGGQAAFAQEVRRRVRQFVPLMAATLIGSVAVALLAVSFLFRQYQPWLPYVVAFVAIRVAFGGAGLYSTALYAAGAQRALYRPAIVAGVVAVGANAMLTRPLGLRGAVIAYCLTQAVVAVLTFAAFRIGERKPEATIAYG
jgi:O-antigen/teichoic acid export membrane protein